MPVLLIDRKRWRRPKAAVNLIHYCLDDRANGIVLLGLWSSYEHVDHLLTNIGFNNGELSLPRISRATIISRWHSNAIQVLHSVLLFSAVSSLRRARSAKQTGRNRSTEKTHTFAR